jgi:hypothetical protein
MGISASLWAVVIGLTLAAAPMVVMWMASPDSGLTWTESLRLGGLLWVVAHGVPVVLAGTTVSLLPWGLVLIPLLLLGTGGTWAARRSGVSDLRSGALLVAAGALAYATAVAVVASVTFEAASRTNAVTAAVHGFVIAGIALSWGALRGAGIDPLALLPTLAAVVVRAGVVAAAAIVGVGSIAAAVSLLTHIDDAITMHQSLGAGVGGGLVLALLGVGYAPVMALWSAAYVMGAGVVVGPESTLSPFLPAATPTELPPFPILAALPQSTTTAAWLLPLTGILAGILAGILVGRRTRREARLVRLALAGGAAAVAGLLLTLGAWMSAGALGDGRLAYLGPVPVTVGVLAAVLVVLGAVPAAVAPSADRRLQVAKVDAAVPPGPVADTPPSPSSEEDHDG